MDSSAAIDSTDGHGGSGGRDCQGERPVDRPGDMISFDAQPLLPPDQLLPLLRSNKSQWFQCYQLRRIGLVESMARNQSTASSDVDFWIGFDQLNPFAAVHLKRELEDMLQRPVDLVRLRKRMNTELSAAALLQEGIWAW